MARCVGAVLITAVAVALLGTARAGGGQDAKAVLDKAAKALGGADRLGKLTAYTIQGKGTISIGGMDSAFTSKGTVQGLDHARSEFEGEFGGNKVQGITVLAGDKGWRKFGDMDLDMDKEAVANEKRSLYLQIVPFNPVLLRGKGFKAQTAGEEKVAGKPAVALKVTGPDGKDFKILYDKQSGLPVRVVAKVVGFMGEEFTQETTYSDYKEFDGLRRPTRMVSKRDGEPFLSQTLTAFRALTKVDPGTFAQPK